MTKSTKCETADPLTEAQCLCLNLRRTTRAVTRFYDGVLAPSGLRVTQFSLLATIRARGPLTMSALAEALVMDRTTLTRNLRPLEKRGLIAVHPGADRRERRVAITPAGSAAAARARQLWRRAQTHMVTALGAPGARALLDQLSETVAAARGD